MIAADFAEEKSLWVCAPLVTLRHSWGIMWQSGSHVKMDGVAGRGTTFNVYLLSLQEPGEKKTSGRQLAEALRLLYPALPVLRLSEYRDDVV